MKIGVLTYFWTENPGTVLQAHSVQRIFEEKYPSSRVEIINVRTWFHLLKPNFSYITPAQWYRDFIRLWKYGRARKEMLNLSRGGITTKDEDKIISYINRQKYDLIVVGSDTCLELCRCSGTESLSPYWLDERVKAEKVMFAPSAREVSIEHLSDKQVKLLKKSVTNFKLMGVRDEGTKTLIKGVYGGKTEIEVIPDPTCSYDIEYGPAVKYLEKRKIPYKSRKIAALHLLRDHPWANELAQKLKERGYLILSLRPASYADYVINDISPVEWAGLFKYYDFVITHRFHDSMFCFKNGTPLLTIIPGRSYIAESGDSKYHTLMRRFGLLETNLIEDGYSVSAAEVLEKLDMGVAAFKECDVENIMNTKRDELLSFADEIKQQIR